MYKIIGDLYERGYSADRYDRIEDFTKTIALVPMSARNGEGLPDLLLVLIGLAQRFLEQQLKTEEGPAQGTILEVKEEKGLGLDPRRDHLRRHPAPRATRSSSARRASR